MPEAEATSPSGEAKTETEQATATPQKAEENAETVETKKVRSVILSAFGSSKHLKVDASEIKPVGRNEIAVDVEACGVNFLDVMTRQGLIEHSIKPPFTPGSECAGVVSEVGEGVTKFKVGDQVVVLMDHGAWSERLVVPIPNASEKTVDGTPEPPTPNATDQSFDSDGLSAVVLGRPSTLEANKAAIMAFAYLPAYFLLHHVAGVRSGDIVLVHSAGGGVGSAVGQLAKLIPNVKLIGIASKCKHEKLSSTYDVLLTPDQDTVGEIRKLYPNGISVVLDCLSGEEINKSLTILKPLGKYILYGMSNLVAGDRKNFLNITKHWFHTERISPLKLYEDNRLLAGFCLKRLLFGRDKNQDNPMLPLVEEVWTELVKLIGEGKIDPWIDSEYHFEDVKEAVMRLQERKNIGKVVLNPKIKDKPATEEAAETTNETPNAQPSETK